jgi:hypothetical protein
MDGSEEGVCARYPGTAIFTILCIDFEIIHISILVSRHRLLAFGCSIAKRSCGAGMHMTARRSEAALQLHPNSAATINGTCFQPPASAFEVVSLRRPPDK